MLESVEVTKYLVEFLYFNSDLKKQKILKQGENNYDVFRSHECISA